MFSIIFFKTGMYFKRESMMIFMGFMLSVRPGFPTPWPLGTAATSCCSAGVRMGVATEGSVVEDDTLGNKK